MAEQQPETTTFSINLRCDGKFLLNSEGVSSLEPVELEDTTWDGSTLTLEGPNDHGMNNVVINNFSGNLADLGFLGNMFGGNTKITVGGKSAQNDTIVVGGVKYKREDGAENATNKKKFSMTWEELGIENPVLGNADLSQKCDLHVQIPLDDSCDIDCSGATFVAIYGNNPNSTLNAGISGAGSLQGQNNKKPSIIGKLTASISGTGNISGFHALKQLKAKVSGVGNINLTHDPKCKPTQHQSGMGKVNLTPMTLAH
ncbi:Hypothetical protein HVR_LOCUS1027 [uncultured virus]|nr:Hypothetical protein HVR_LOCUS1027 [uncultured virus]